MKLNRIQALNLKMACVFMTAAITTGCLPTAKVSVSPIAPGSSPQKSTLIYALPLTQLAIDFTIVKTTFVPGPYHQYANKYLAIEGAESEPYTAFNIQAVNALTLYIADKQHFFSIYSPKGVSALHNSIGWYAENNLVITADRLPTQPAFKYSSSTRPAGPYFTDLSVKRNLVVEKETTYKRVLRDSLYVQVPVTSEKIRSKSLETKAEEAANFIIKTRKRRFKLLTGQTDTDISAGNVKDGAEELHRLEQQYTELFTGKYIADTLKYTVNFEPEANHLNQQKILFLFDAKQGVTTSPSGKEVSITLSVPGPPVTVAPQSAKMGTTDKLYYRLPVMAGFTISFDKKELLSGNIPVFQLGQPVSSEVKVKK